GNPWEGDTRHLTADGRSLDVHVTYSPVQADDGDIAGVVAVSFDISQRLKAERRTSASLAVTQILSGADHIYEAAPELLRAVCENLEWDFGALWRVDRLNGEMRCVDAWRGHRPDLSEFEDATRWLTLKKGVGLPGRVWEARATRWITDIASDNNFSRRREAAEAGLNSGVGFPILLRGEVLGVLEFFSAEVRPEDEDLIAMVTAVGSQIGQFMERKQAEEDRRLSEARTSAVVMSAMDAIVAMDHLGKVLDFNPAAEETFGYKREEAIGREMASLIIPSDLRDAHRRGLLRFLETGDAVVTGKRIEITAQRKDGSIFPVELTVQKVDMPGPPVFTGYIRDITERKESERERLRLLEAEQEARAAAERASRRLTQLQRITDAALSHLALEDLLDELLARITDILNSDMSAILLVREDGQDLAVRAVRGLKSDVTQIAPIPLGRQAAGSVALTGRPVIVGDLQASGYEAPVLKREGMRSMMVVPLLLENRTLGVFVTATKEAQRFTEDDLALLQLAADRIASPIQNASLFEREHRIATQLQKSLLPRKLPQLKNLEVCERYVPGGAGLQVGGDWYDVMDLPAGLSGLVIGDVVGKGIRAASVMGQLRNALRAFAFEARDPGDV
ncbi:MAG: GAF domain-containing protein, partial [Actinomycetota bacterium]